MSRYFKVVDQEIIDGLKELFELRHEKQIKVREAVEPLGAEHVYFRRRGLFGQSVGGFKACEVTDELREKCTKPTSRNDYLIRPRKSGPGHDKKLYEKWLEVCDLGYVDEDQLDDLIGFNHLSFFPTSPGFNFRPHDNFMGWIMPDHVTELKGCEEITNIEWLELTKKDEETS